MFFCLKIFNKNKKRTYNVHPELQKIYNYQFYSYMKGKDTSIFFIHK